MPKQTNGINKKQQIDFAHFLRKFPEVDLPVILSDDTHHDFSMVNDPLPMLMIEQYILPLEDNEPDDLTEFVACFRIRDTKDFHAIVYWRAALMDYHYTLATFTKKGVLIDKRVIAGTYSDGETVTQSVATIDEELNIYVVSGQAGTIPSQYNASSSTAYQLEILPEGQIVNV